MIATKKEIELKDGQHTFKEREQRLKEMKYADKIQKMNVGETCPQDRARYALLQEEIRSQYC